ncbi:MAG: 5-carboxymethyl-2-hydroxymuconate isomerase, partial [Rubrivivax sp.]
MPHCVILYTAQLDREADMGVLCRQLADAMLGVRDDEGAPLFPPGGTRVLAYPAAHWAVGDGGAAGIAAGRFDGHPGGSGDYAFAYLQLRMGRGRSAATQQRAGQALHAVAQAFFAPLIERRPLGVTVQVD